MSCQVLASDSISSRITVDESTFQDDRLEVFVDVCDYTGLRLVNLIKFEIFRHVNDLLAFERDRDEKISVNLLRINSDEEVPVLKIPQHGFGVRAEVGNHELLIGDRIVESTLASVVNANDAGSLSVREHFGDLVLSLVLHQKRLILDQVVHQFTVCIKHNEERVDDVELNDGGLRVWWELKILSLLPFDCMHCHNTIRQDCRPHVVKLDRFDRSEVVSLAYKLWTFLHFLIVIGPPAIIPD